MPPKKVQPQSGSPLGGLFTAECPLFNKKSLLPDLAERNKLLDKIEFRVAGCTCTPEEGDTNTLLHEMKHFGLKNHKGEADWTYSSIRTDLADWV